MSRHSVAVVILHITYAWTITLDLVGKATWEACSGNLEKKNGNHHSICSRTQENQEEPVSSRPVAGPSSHWLLASSPASK
jgi:hypothetical protein